MPPMRRLSLLATALATALYIAACGGGNGTTSTQTATGPHVSPAAFESCLNKRGLKTGPPGSDALLASYGQQAVAQDGATFVIVSPATQVIAFSQNVDLAQAKSALGTAEQQGGVRADNLHAETSGNVLIIYFVATTPESTAVIHACLGGKATPLPGFEKPYSAPSTSSTTQPAE
jgi:hypothetical protein